MASWSFASEGHRASDNRTKRWSSRPRCLPNPVTTLLPPKDRPNLAPLAAARGCRRQLHLSSRASTVAGNNLTTSERWHPPAPAAPLAPAGTTSTGGHPPASGGTTSSGRPHQPAAAAPTSGNSTGCTPPRSSCGGVCVTATNTKPNCGTCGTSQHSDQACCASRLPPGTCDNQHRRRDSKQLRRHCGQQVRPPVGDRAATAFAAPPHRTCSRQPLLHHRTTVVWHQRLLQWNLQQHQHLLCRWNRLRPAGQCCPSATPNVCGHTDA